MIILAIEKNGTVYAYNESKQQCLNVSGELMGYTCKTVAVKQEKTIYVYGFDGQQIAQFPNDFIDFNNIAGAIL